MRLPTFSVETVLAGSAQIIDLRSPAEFARDHLPGAQSVPLLDDEQRAIVGTLYKQESAEAAYDAGLAMVESGMGARLEAILQRQVDAEEWRLRFGELAAGLRAQMREPSVLCELEPSLDVLGEQPLIVHCWRGGMRSQSVALLLRALGETRVGLLKGGYKRYRQWVIDQLDALSAKDLRLITLRGATGVGKTEVLRALEARCPGSTLDLEGLAGHRSSVLGAIGLQPQSQPHLESLLVQRIPELCGSQPVFVEAESRKVGDLIVPQALFEAMQAAPQVRLEADVEHRVELLGRDYLGDADQPDPARLAACAEAIGGLRGKLGAAQVEAWQAALLAGRWREVVRGLLADHYDPLYAHGEARHGLAATVDAADPQLLDRLLALREELTAHPTREG